MSLYYYASGPFGMTASGSFTKNRSRWMLFTANEKNTMEQQGKKPYGATKNGAFVPTEKYTDPG